MNNTIIKGLLGLSVLLLLVLLIEWQVGQYIESPEGLATSTEVTEELPIELPKLILTKQTEESYSAMVESPLFIEGRKPIIDGVDEKEDEVAGKVDDLTLLGIYSIKDKTMVLFNKKGKGRNYLKKVEGEDVSGWQIIEIKADSVVLEQRGNKQTLMLRKPKPKKLKRTNTRRRLKKKIKPKSREPK